MDELRDPVERERIKKQETWRKFYNIDVKPGDIVKYEDGFGIFYGLVTETVTNQSIVEGVTNLAGKIVWTSEKDSPKETRDWYIFNSKNWSVMTR